MKVFVDTSAFYALVSATDHAHHRALAIHDRLKAEAIPLATSNYVFLEAFSLLQRRHGVEDAEQFGEFVSRHVELVWVGADQHRAAWDYWQRHRKRGLSLVDCSCFVVMQTLGVRHAFAFDEQFREAGFTLLQAPPEMVGEARGAYRVGRRKRAH